MCSEFSFDLLKRVDMFTQYMSLFRSLSHKAVWGDIVVINNIILTLEKLASIAIAMYENKNELLSKQKKS
jgi:hypothetical protein